jgi:hypothetical protein
MCTQVDSKNQGYNRIYTDLYLTDKILYVLMSDEESSKKIMCDQCGVTFTTQQDKEEHMKLEHKEGKGPTGMT